MNEYWAQFDYKAGRWILQTEQPKPRYPADDILHLMDASVLEEWKASQSYRYIGRDGKAILARQLEDQLIETQKELADVRDRLKMYEWNEENA